MGGATRRLVYLLTAELADRVGQRRRQEVLWRAVVKHFERDYAYIVTVHG